MKIKYLAKIIVFIVFTLLVVQISFAQEVKIEKGKVATFSGKVFRSDTKESITKVRIFLLDEKKTEKKDNSVETFTDEKGNFSFEQIVPGKYTISIQAVFDKEEDVPCQLLMGKINEPNSRLVVLTDKNNGKKIEQIFIEGFEFKKGKEIKKEFDLVCKSLFGK